MTDPMYSQPEVPQAVDPWATGELRSDPTTSTPTPTTLPEQPMPVPQQPMPLPPQPPAMRGVAPVPVPAPPSTPSGGWDPVSYGGGGGGGPGRRSVVIAALAALAVVVGVFAFVLTNSRDWFSTPSANGTTNPPANTSPTSPTGPAGPFVGTQAQDFAKGTDGIVVPAAAEVPGLTSAQVKSALDKVRSALQAARLDPKMLTGHDTSVLLGLLASDNRDYINTKFAAHDFLGFATQLGPGLKLSADGVRVKGEMTFSAAVSDDAVHARELRIDTNVVWVYGFDGPSTAPGQRMVTIHDQLTWYVPADADVAPSSRGLFLGNWHAFTYNMDCTLVKDDLIGLGQPSTVSAAPSVDVNKLLDPHSTVEVQANTC